MDSSTDFYLATDYCPVEDYPEDSALTTKGPVKLGSLELPADVWSPSAGGRVAVTVSDVATTSTHVYRVSPVARPSYQVAGDQLLALVLVRAPEVRGSLTVRWADEVGLHSEPVSSEVEGLVVAKTKPQPGTTYDIPAGPFYAGDEEWRSCFRLRYVTVDYPLAEVGVDPRALGAVASMVPPEYLVNATSVREAFLEGLMSRGAVAGRGMVVPHVRNVEGLLWSLGVSFEVESRGRLRLGSRSLSVPFEISYEGIGTHLRLSVGSSPDRKFAYLSGDFGIRWS